MDELPSGAPALEGWARIAADAMAHRLEAAEFFDVDVDHLAGPCTFVAVHGLGGFQCIDPVEAKPLEDAADGGWREIEFGGDLFAGAPRPAKHLYLFDHRLRRRPVQSMRPRAA